MGEIKHSLGKKTVLHQKKKERVMKGEIKEAE